MAGQVLCPVFVKWSSYLCCPLNLRIPSKYFDKGAVSSEAIASCEHGKACAVCRAASADSTRRVPEGRIPSRPDTPLRACLHAAATVWVECALYGHPLNETASMHCCTGTPRSRRDSGTRLAGGTSKQTGRLRTAGREGKTAVAMADARADN